MCCSQKLFFTAVSCSHLKVLRSLSSSLRMNCFSLLKNRSVERGPGWLVLFLWFILGQQASLDMSKCLLTHSSAIIRNICSVNHLIVARVRHTLSLSILLAYVFSLLALVYSFSLYVHKPCLTLTPPVTDSSSGLLMSGGSQQAPCWWLHFGVNFRRRLTQLMRIL